MDKEKILILGASSKLAQAIVRLIRAETNYKLIISSGNEHFINYVQNEKVFRLDPFLIKDLKSLCMEIKPNVIINTLGYSNIEQCEKDKKIAWDLNAGIVTNLVSICKVLEAHLITFSTDNIYDGEKGPYIDDAKPNPINNFGKTKLAAENVCMSTSDRSTILRLTPFFGWAGFDKHDFVTQCVVKLMNKEQFSEPDWRYTNPVFIDDVAAGVIKILFKKRFGAFNIGGSEYISKYQAATIIAKVYGYDDSLVQPEETPSIKRDKIPRRAGLITLKTEIELGIKPTQFESAIITARYQKNISNKYMSSKRGLI